MKPKIWYLAKWTVDLISVMVADSVRFCFQILCSLSSISRAHFPRDNRNPFLDACISIYVMQIHHLTSHIIHMSKIKIMVKSKEPNIKIY